MSRVGLVLGAGGMVGQAYHAGVLRALAESGWDPRSAEVVVGTSAGSIVGGLLRRGVPVDDLVSGAYRRGQLPQNEPGPAVAEAAVAAVASVGRGPARIGARLAGMLPAGRTSVGGIIRMMQLAGGDAWPSRTTWICGVRRRDGRRVVFGSDAAPEAPFSKAVAASCAIPGYFAPVQIRADGATEEYVDGGAHSPTNLDLVARAGLDLVVVISPMSGTSLAPRLDLGARLLFRGLLGGESLAVRRCGVPVLTFQPGGSDLEVMGLNAMSARPWRAVADAATASARRHLATHPWPA